MEDRPAFGHWKTQISNLKSQMSNLKCQITNLQSSISSAGCGRGQALNADFHGRENNQSFRGRKPRFLRDLSISALGSLIVYLARNDSIGRVSTVAVL